MNCSNAERNIYLLEELPEHEKRALLTHVASCDGCAAIYRQTLETKRLLSAAFAPPVHDPMVLTNRIMQRIGNVKQERRNIFDAFPGRLEAKPVRYAFATVSLVLIMFFGGEISRPEQIISKSKQVPGRKNVKFNEAFFAGLVKRPGAMLTDNSGLSAGYCLKVCEDREAEACQACMNRYIKN